ncbi:hypothetical protein BJF83_05915 [Nocardiopsis sp. CNR-923]|uniref:hypothetical protein n=1 Tax=Nocardiopsis sp. CNR-923 TaxID=1904965 RepID=UPI00095E1F0D|nr:hypothetical protein [Nocardiopsis sp. CNR-923]OLT25003.1 hypothetical protein BJF83_05915 [Nocardiopsis sp. CNR-923]
MNKSAGPSPTEVVISWIPHDARFRDRAVRHALSDLTGQRLFVYVNNLVTRSHDDGRPLGEYDLRTMDAVLEDLDHRPLAAVDWRRVREKLIQALG